MIVYLVINSRTRVVVAVHSTQDGASKDAHERCMNPNPHPDQLYYCTESWMVQDDTR